MKQLIKKDKMFKNNLESITEEDIRQYKIYKLNKQTLENYLENEIHFRDYSIKIKSLFGKYNKVAVHQIININNLERDIKNALDSFYKDGFGHIVFYI